MMTFQAVFQEAKALSLQERQELIKLLVDTLTVETPTEPTFSSRPRNLMELAGLGAEIWEGIDAQDYVNQLRNEWDQPS